MLRDLPERDARDVPRRLPNRQADVGGTRAAPPRISFIVTSSGGVAAVEPAREALDRAIADWRTRSTAAARGARKQRPRLGASHHAASARVSLVSMILIADLTCPTCPTRYKTILFSGYRRCPAPARFEARDQTATVRSSIIVFTADPFLIAQCRDRGPLQCGQQAEKARQIGAPHVASARRVPALDGRPYEQRQFFDLRPVAGVIGDELGVRLR